MNCLAARPGRPGEPGRQTRFHALDVKGMPFVASLVAATNTNLILVDIIA